MYAVNVALSRTGAASPAGPWPSSARSTPPTCCASLGGSPDRALAAARAVAADASGSTGYPMLWRQAALAVELCQRAAEIAGAGPARVIPARQPGKQGPALAAQARG